MLIPVRNAAAGHAVGGIVCVALLEINNVEDWKMILINIQWLDLRHTTLGLHNVVSIGVDDEQPNLSVEHRTAEFIKNGLTIDLTTDVAIDTFVVLDDPNIFIVVSDDVGKFWDPNISIVE